ncbi:MAG: hypothetical protein ACJ75J_06185 [Cytophagaceae bacterium]
MKKAFIFLVLIFSSGFSFSQTNAYSDLNGLWADSNSAAFSNAYIIFSQEGSSVTFSHYLEFKGIPMVEYGKGKISGNKVEYKVKVSKPIPGWARKGFHSLLLSADGKTLRGIYKDEKGNTGPLVFKKIR